MERRAFLRFNVNLEVRYRILESLKNYKLTATEDMSERGIKITLPEYIEPGSMLELTIKVPQDSHPIGAIGRLIWIKKDLLEEFFTAGIHLVHIKEKDKQRFYKYAIF
ncbi:MAG: PilZ domain-containing protein [Candidatus Omnitrophica bacterium]|nr:PilZ domain-containing protein [Candidatus Omnitrophota bacterium]